MELTLPLPPTTSPGELPSKQFEGNWLQALVAFAGRLIVSPVTSNGGVPLVEGLAGRVISLGSVPGALIAQNFVDGLSNNKVDRPRLGWWAGRIATVIISAIAGLMELNAAENSVVSEYNKLRSEGITAKLIAPLRNESLRADDELDATPTRT